MHDAKEGIERVAKALSCDSRVRIINVLSIDPAIASKVAELAELKPHNTVKHLEHLRAASLVERYENRVWALTRRVVRRPEGLLFRGPGWSFILKVKP